MYRVEAGEPRSRLAAFLPRRIASRRSDRRLLCREATGSWPSSGRNAPVSKGSCTLLASGLPSGMSFSEADVPADLFCVPVVFESGTDSPFAGGLAEVLATAKTPLGTLSGGFLQVVDLVAGSADTLFASVDVDRLAVAVVEEYPFSITLDEPKTDLAQDGTIALQIHIERTADFNGPVDVTVPFLPPWVDGPEKITIPEEESSAVYTARAFSQAEPRTWRLLCRSAIIRQLGAATREEWRRGWSSIAPEGTVVRFRVRDRRFVKTRHGARCGFARGRDDWNRRRRTGKRIYSGRVSSRLRPVATADDRHARRIAESSHGKSG